MRPQQLASIEREAHGLFPVTATICLFDRSAWPASAPCRLFVTSAHRCAPDFCHRRSRLCRHYDHHIVDDQRHAAMPHRIRRAAVARTFVRHCVLPAERPGSAVRPRAQHIHPPTGPGRRRAGRLHPSTPERTPSTNSPRPRGRSSIIGRHFQSRRCSMVNTRGATTTTRAAATAAAKPRKAPWLANPGESGLRGRRHPAWPVECRPRRSCPLRAGSATTGRQQVDAPPPPASRLLQPLFRVVQIGQRAHARPVAIKPEAEERHHHPPPPQRHESAQPRGALS